MKWLSKFKKNYLIKDQSSNVAFDELMNKAHKIYRKKNSEGLIDLQRIVLRAVQSQHICNAYICPAHSAIRAFDELKDFGLGYIPGLKQTFVNYLSYGIKELNGDKKPTLKLGKDMIIPTTWHPSSIINTLGWIGSDRQNNWKFDKAAHYVTWWEPFNIGWITSAGNHSIAQGIIQAEGELIPNEAYDLSDLYEHIAFDGQKFICAHSQKQIGIPRYNELGWIFEIGRLISQLKRVKSVI